MMPPVRLVVFAVAGELLAFAILVLPWYHGQSPVASWAQSNKPLIDVILSANLVLATAALAIFTANLFSATRDVATRTGDLASKTNEVAAKTAELATDTVDASRWADQHHQEQFSPIVIWEVKSCEYHLVSEIGRADRRTLNIFGDLRNIGGGPALNIKAFVKMGDYETDPNNAIQLGFIAAGESRSAFAIWIEDHSLAVFGDVQRAKGPFTVMLWAFSQFGVPIESTMIGDGNGKLVARFEPTKIKKRDLPGSVSG